MFIGSAETSVEDLVTADPDLGELLPSFITAYLPLVSSTSAFYSERITKLCFIQQLFLLVIFGYKLIFQSHTVELNPNTLTTGLRYGLDVASGNHIVDEDGRPIQPNYELDGGQPLLANPLATAERFPVEDHDQHWTRWFEIAWQSSAAARTRAYVAYLWVRVTNLI